MQDEGYRQAATWQFRACVRQGKAGRPFGPGTVTLKRDFCWGRNNRTFSGLWLWRRSTWGDSHDKAMRAYAARPLVR
jgi:hypothetical protein